MIPYFVIFASSTFLLDIASNERCDKNDLLAFLLEVLSFILLCSFAGARDTGIGVDTTGYGIWLYDLVEDSDSFQSFIFLAMNSNTHMDLLFAIQAYIVVKITGSIFWYYFMIQLAIVLPVYLAIRDLAKPQMVAPCMLFYLVLFYIPGLNGMRQSIAMGLLLLAFSKLYKGSKLAPLILYICSIFYHSSAVIGIIPLLGWSLFIKRTKFGAHELRYLSKIGTPFAIAVVILVILNIRPLVLWATTTFSFLSKYAYAYEFMGASYRAYYVIYGMLYITLIFLAWRNGTLKSKTTIFLIVIVFLAFPLHSLEIYSQALQRMAQYMLLFAVLLLAFAVPERKPLQKMDLSYLAVYACALCAFVFFFAISGNHEAIPYTSELLGLG